MSSPTAELNARTQRHVLRSSYALSGKVLLDTREQLLRARAQIVCVLYRATDIVGDSESRSQRTTQAPGSRSRTSRMDDHRVSHGAQQR